MFISDRTKQELVLILGQIQNISLFEKPSISKSWSFSDFLAMMMKARMMKAMTMKGMAGTKMLHYAHQDLMTSAELLLVHSLKHRLPTHSSKNATGSSQYEQQQLSYTAQEQSFSYGALPRPLCGAKYLANSKQKEVEG